MMVQILFKQHDMRAIKNKVLFKPLPADEISEGGIYVPETARKVSNKGVLVSVGENVKSFKEGDVCFRVKDWGQEYIIEGEKHYLMEANTILAKL